MQEKLAKNCERSTVRNFKIAYRFKCGVLSTSKAESEILKKILKQQYERVGLQKH